MKKPFFLAIILLAIIFFSTIASAQECITTEALANYITQWKTDSTAFPMPMLMSKIADWKSGANCAVGMCSSISQYGITWTFDKEYQCGQFVNGDYWVLGPVQVTTIDPAPVNGRNGSVVNPMPTLWEHAYDSRVDPNNYNPSLLVSMPLTLQTNSSLISTISWEAGQPGCPAPYQWPGSFRPTLRTAAVLTCLPDVPPAGSFRPPYSGSAKPLYSASDLQYQILPRLAPVTSTPSFDTAQHWLERVWLDHVIEWPGEAFHPSENMPGYGRDLAARINDVSLMLMLDIPEQQKQKLAVQMVQLGIDLQGIVKNGSSLPYLWGMDGGGIGGGRKWPILFAGLLLNNTEMKSVGTTYGLNRFQEDCQTFYVTQDDITRFPYKVTPYYEGTQNWYGWESTDIGKPDWGARHCDAPQNDYVSRDYRRCCTANAWHGAVLSARMLDAKALWNHDALFEYMDQYMATETLGQYTRSWTRFAEDMWDTYRNCSNEIKDGSETGIDCGGVCPNSCP